MLKKSLHRYFTLLMALLVLTSSTGVGLVENDCTMRGKTVDFIFKEKKKGCKLCHATRGKIRPAPETESPVFRKMHCCLEKQQLKIVEYQVTTIKSTEKALKSPNPALIPAWFSFHNAAEVTILSDLSVFGSPHSFSSPYSGRSMLSFVQSFLI